MACGAGADLDEVNTRATGDATEGDSPSSSESASEDGAPGTFEATPPPGEGLPVEDMMDVPTSLDPADPQGTAGEGPPSGTAPEGEEPDSSEGGSSGQASPGALLHGPQPTQESARAAGPFDVDTLTQGLRDGPEYGSQTLFFPTDAEPPFAMVAVVPGFVSPESSIQDWGPFLASHGMVTLTIGTNSGGDPPDVRARALLDALETIAFENEREESPLFGDLDLDRRAVMGWSMGGGGTLIAANENPQLRAAISLAGWSPGAQFSDNEVPTLLFAGTADILAGGQSQGFFESIPQGTPKMLFEVEGGSHSVANSPSGAGGEVGLYGLSWLKVFLEGDDRYLPFLSEIPSRQSDFRVNLQ